MAPYLHNPVMAEACLTGLAVRKGGIYADCTLGGGGHARLILKALEGTGALLGLDRDESAIQAAGGALEKESTGSQGGTRILLRQANFDSIDRICAEVGIPALDGALLDLGVSSHQLDEEERGFSYQGNARLDMRMDRGSGMSAYELVNTWSIPEIGRIIRMYGEERWARRIASFIGNARETGPITTTGQLADLIRNAIPAAARRTGPHPARRTFQAIRIAVNDELGALERGLEKCLDLLSPEGRICVLTYHSLEDRIVKKAFIRAEHPCTCPGNIPVCVCGHGEPRIEILTRKPLLPSGEEVEGNPRARSAKLRIARKLIYQ